MEQEFENLLTSRNLTAQSDFFKLKKKRFALYLPKTKLRYVYESFGNDPAFSIAC